MDIEKRGRHFAVLDPDGTLVCLAAYKCGAEEVVRRLNGTPPPPKPGPPLYAPVLRVALVKEGCHQVPERIIQTPKDAAAVLASYLADRDRETFAVLALSSKNRLLGIHTVSIGCLDAAMVHPREVFKAAILSNCAGLIVGHNHPSGDPEPSPEDRQVTIRLIGAGELLGIDVLDHLVLGEEGRFTSVREEQPDLWPVVVTTRRKEQYGCLSCS